MIRFVYLEVGGTYLNYVRDSFCLSVDVFKFNSKYSILFAKLTNGLTVLTCHIGMGFTALFSNFVKLDEVPVDYFES